MSRTKAPSQHTEPTTASSCEGIKIRGARVNNLKNVSCVIPKDHLVVITGPSGSGKSSLAFDTLFAEGQRRYIESMSAYARQFFARIEKPDVDHIDHILPSVALEQKNSVKNARSTVGTATEAYDYLRILFASVGKTVCPQCNLEVSKTNPKQIAEYLNKHFEDGDKILLLAPVTLRETPAEVLTQQGFYRIYKDGEMLEWVNLDPGTINPHETIQVVIDRMIVRHSKDNKAQKINARLMESIQNGVALGKGKLTLLKLDTEEAQTFQSTFACTGCEQVFKEPTPHFFSFNSPLGACATCEGFGKIIGLDMDKVIPNKALSVQQGAIHPFTLPSNQDIYKDLLKIAKKHKLPVDVPYEELTDAHKRLLIEGEGDYPGIRGFFNWLESKKYKVHVRVMLAKYRGYYPCPDCLGSRIHKEALYVFVGDKTMKDITDLSVQDLLSFFKTLKLSKTEAQLAERTLKEITGRLQYLEQIGLGYLTLNRQSRTLSNGESQRINLSATLGCALTDTLYVLDEPTVGLHARDTERLIGTLQKLRDHGNTVVVVEHDPEVILAADHVIDMGPGGGGEGGRIVYEGDTKGLIKTTYSPTANYLNKNSEGIRNAAKHAAENTPLRLNKKDWIEITGASGNNLKGITVKIPKRKLVCVSGVSGSGKSTLLKQTLFAAHERQKGQSLQLDMAEHKEINGLENFKDVLMIDQSPPGRSVRSNPITYVKAYDEIRKLFSESRKAMVLGITPGHFSFNTPGGRCETCQGLGTLTIDMQFMADVTMTCHDCQGKRFNHNVLSIEVGNKNIYDVLSLTVDEALHFFAKIPAVKKKLKPLAEIGLGYLQLGQSTATLSGGEAQRLKLANYLQTDDKYGEYLFLFDEPTTGLHMADIDLLVQAFRRILESGHSLIVIEHNIDFIAQADYVIDLGPEGGDGGGEIVAEGSVGDIMACKASHTGRYLKTRLEG